MQKKQHVNKKTIGYAVLFASLTWLIQPIANAQSDTDILESARLCQSVSALSSRLACYDRILPPTAEAVNSDDSPASREELEKTVATLQLQLEIDKEAQIIEVHKPNIRTSRLVAADGRVFVQSKATSVTQWPDTPFDIEIGTSLMGTKYILLPGRQDRIRISLEE